MAKRSRGGAHTGKSTHPKIIAGLQLVARLRVWLTLRSMPMDLRKKSSKWRSVLPSQRMHERKDRFCCSSLVLCRELQGSLRMFCYTLPSSYLRAVECHLLFSSLVPLIKTYKHMCGSGCILQLGN